MFSNVIYGTASVSTGFSTLTGYRITETSNALGAVVTFRNAASGTILSTIPLAAGATASEQFGENPFASSFGPIYLSIDSGTVQFAVYGK